MATQLPGDLMPIRQRSHREKARAITADDKKFDPYFSLRQARTNKNLAGTSGVTVEECFLCFFHIQCSKTTCLLVYPVRCNQGTVREANHNYVIIDNKQCWIKRQARPVMYSL